MKILLVMDCSEEFINGVSQSVLNLEKGLADAGEDVRILMLSPDGKGRIEEKYFLIPSHGLSVVYPGFRYSFRLTGKIHDYILAWKPDIIHSNTEGILYFKAGALARETGAKHIHSFHTNFLDFYYRYFPFTKSFSQKLMIFYGNRCFRNLQGVITPSLWGQHIMDRFSFPAPHYVLPNGIHTEIFSSDKTAARETIRLRYGVKPSDTLLIFAGRLAAEKNIPRLISYFCSIKNDSIKLMITGGGPELKKLKKQAEDTGKKQRIFFTDMVPTEKMPDYYKAADIFVTASESEVQPLTYVEAMASGLPVVCADAPYIEGLVVNGVTGFSFSSEEAFKEAIDRFTLDPCLRLKIGVAAKARVIKEYSIENFAASALSVYANVLKGDNT